MKHFEDPKMDVQKIMVEDVITTSNDCENVTDADR